MLSNVELAAGAISSMLRDSDLKRSGALPIEKVLALSLGRLRKFPCLFVFAFILVLSFVLTLCWVSAGGYPSKKFGKKGQVERGSRHNRQSLQSESGLSYLRAS